MTLRQTLRRQCVDVNAGKKKHSLTTFVSGLLGNLCHGRSSAASVMTSLPGWMHSRGRKVKNDLFFRHLSVPTLVTYYCINSAGELDKGGKKELHYRSVQLVKASCNWTTIVCTARTVCNILPYSAERDCSPSLPILSKIEYFLFQNPSPSPWMFMYISLKRLWLWCSGLRAASRVVSVTLLSGERWNSCCYVDNRLRYMRRTSVSPPLGWLFLFIYLSASKDRTSQDERSLCRPAENPPSPALLLSLPPLYVFWGAPLCDLRGGAAAVPYRWMPSQY